MSDGNPFTGPQPGMTEMSRDDSKLTNHQRIKDREMQRAFDQGVEVPFLPTRSRARRAGTTQKRIIDTYQANMAINRHEEPAK